MSFMYNPFPYDDPRPVNRPELTENATKSIVAGSAKAAAALAGEIAARMILDKELRKVKCSFRMIRRSTF